MKLISTFLQLWSGSLPGVLHSRDPTPDVFMFSDGIFLLIKYSPTACARRFDSGSFILSLPVLSVCPVIVMQ